MEKRLKWSLLGGVSVVLVICIYSISAYRPLKNPMTEVAVPAQLQYKAVAVNYSRALAEMFDDANVASKLGGLIRRTHLAGNPQAKAVSLRIPQAITTDSLELTLNKNGLRSGTLPELLAFARDNPLGKKSIITISPYKFSSQFGAPEPLGYSYIVPGKLRPKHKIRSGSHWNIYGDPETWLLAINDNL